MKLQKSKKQRIPRKVKKKIPHGMYCYQAVKYVYPTDGSMPYLKIKSCPFFKWVKGEPQDFSPSGTHFGRCNLLDFEDEAGLNDQCKICSINKP